MKLRPHTFLSAVLALLALSLPGCWKGRGGFYNPFAPAGARGIKGQIHVTVHNNNYNDAVIHAFRGGQRTRLGQVTGKSERVFVMRWDFSLSLGFDVHLIGDGGCQVSALTVHPGDEVWVRIPMELGVTLCDSWKS